MASSHDLKVQQTQKSLVTSQSWECRSCLLSTSHSVCLSLGGGSNFVKQHRNNSVPASQIKAAITITVDAASSFATFERHRVSSLIECKGDDEISGTFAVVAIHQPCLVRV